MKLFYKFGENKQRGAVLLTLEIAAEKAALELDASVIDSNDTVKSVTQQRDKLPIIDKTLETFQA